MKRLVPIALTVLVATTGCHMFSSKKNPAAPKESKTVAADVEKEFMQRWIEKRTTDLVAQGKSQQDAHSQAVAEFKVNYSYTAAAASAK
jgi:hypothetical protein